MRVNRFIASNSGLSRRAVDDAIREGRVAVDGKPAELGQQVEAGAQVELDGNPVAVRQRGYALMNKPVGYVTSRRRQGKSKTIYDLLPEELHRLNPVGRLDKDSCGLLLMTDDGELAQELSHPSRGKVKTYVVKLNREVSDSDLLKLREGVELADGPSRMEAERKGAYLEVKLAEGRNRQIRRTFQALGYKVVYLERVALGALALKLKPGEVRQLSREEVAA